MLSTAISVISNLYKPNVVENRAYARLNTRIDKHEIMRQLSFKHVVTVIGSFQGHIGRRLRYKQVVMSQKRPKKETRRRQITNKCAYTLYRLALLWMPEWPVRVSPCLFRAGSMEFTSADSSWPVAVTDSVLRATKICRVPESTMIHSHSASVTV